MIYPYDYLVICPKCHKAVAHNPDIPQDFDRCPYCGMNVKEAEELKYKGEWLYEWR